MIDKIRVAIADCIKNNFSDNIKVYEKAVKQGLEKPCFFIDLDSSKRTQKLLNRYYDENRFVIECHPDDGADNTYLFEISKQMSDVLDIIAVGKDELRGSNMESEIKEGILYFYVNYNISLIKPEIEEISMKNYTLERGINNE